MNTSCKNAATKKSDKSDKSSDKSDKSDKSGNMYRKKWNAFSTSSKCDIVCAICWNANCTGYEDGSACPS